jgi:hypothetical protein
MEHQKLWIRWRRISSVHGGGQLRERQFLVIIVRRGELPIVSASLWQGRAMFFDVLMRL